MARTQGAMEGGGADGHADGEHAEEERGEEKQLLVAGQEGSEVEEGGWREEEGGGRHDGCVRPDS